MTNILPKYTGLSVNAVSYQYTTTKRAEDPFVVSVENLRASGSGYVFRSVDDWTGLRGNTITKTVPVADISATEWGRGQITTTGVGQVVDYSVFYNFSYDTCSAAVVTDPACPNYKPPSSGYSVGEDPYVTASYQLKPYNYLDEEENAKKQVLDESGSKASKRQNPNNSRNLLLTAQALGLARSLEALNNIPNFASYSTQIPGGVYNDVLRYPDKKLPDSSNSRRLSASQERLHTKLTEEQYLLKSKDTK